MGFAYYFTEMAHSLLNKYSDSDFESICLYAALALHHLLLTLGCDHSIHHNHSNLHHHNNSRRYMNQTVLDIENDNNRIRCQLKLRKHIINSLITVNSAVVELKV